MRHNAASLATRSHSLSSMPTRSLLPALWRFIFALGAALAAAVVAAPLPVAPVKEVTDVLHGVTVKDPYRYFENVAAPEVQTWLRAQGAAAREALDRIELR